MQIPGGCHCGNIRFTLAWDPDPAEIPARACDCSFCVKHGGVWTSTPKGRLEVSIADAESVNDYAFGTHTAKFHVCTRCGVVPVVTSEVEGRRYAVVSVNAFEGDARKLLRPQPASFGGEDVPARLARRTRNWIPEVRFRTEGEVSR